MIKLKVSPNLAEQKIRLIEHPVCNRGADKHWNVKCDKNGNYFATPQSICWLFCWAKTGKGSIKAQDQSRKAFDEIFEPSFGWLDSRLDHKLATVWRYSKNSIESVFFAHIQSRK